MTTRSTLVAGAPAGAGRSVMIMWPGLNDTINDGSAATATQQARLGVTSNVTVAIGAAGLGAASWRNYGISPTSALTTNSPSQGTPALRMTSGVVGDAVSLKFNQSLFPEIEQLLPGGVPDPFFRVWRFVARMAIVPLAGAINAEATFGLAMIPGGNTSINGGGAKPGIMLGPTNVGTISLRARHDNVAGYRTQQDATVAQLGLTTYDQWLTYELRAVGSDATGPAQLKAFINGRQLGNSVNFGPAAGPLLPSPSAAGGGFKGLFPWLIADNVVGGTIYLRWMALILSPDEGANL